MVIDGFQNIAQISRTHKVPQQFLYKQPFPMPNIAQNRSLLHIL